jgi:uncharacterized membrane protein YqiK
VSWDSQIIWSMPLWLCIAIVALSGLVALILMWADR